MLLVSGRVSVPKPLSQIQRSTRWLLQGLSPRTSFGGFGLRTLCEQKGVKLLTCHGQIYEGPEGEFLDFATTWAKYQQVLRAQQSSKDGLKFRAENKGLRPAGRPPLGYEYPITNNVNDPSRLIPSRYWPLIDRIWKRFLGGASIHQIVREFEYDGIPSPRGKPRWDPSSISQMLKNPIYAGRPYGLRYKAVQPIKRVSDRSYGKSSMADKPFEEWVPLNPNPPKDTDGRSEESGRGWVRELQGRWPGVLG